MSNQASYQQAYQASRAILRELVTPEGIFASSSDGWSGLYHSWFGRDSAIVSDLVLHTANEEPLMQNTRSALRSFTRWQGKLNIAAYGEEAGKIPHEVITKESNHFGTMRDDFLRRTVWYFDEERNAYINWDSADSTPLWIISTLRSVNGAPDEELKISIRSALQWCLNNMERFDGWGSWLGADLQEGRQIDGLHNQSWKDNFGAYQYEDGSLVEQPIKDVFVNGSFWAALKYGAELFHDEDPHFSRLLHEKADNLKANFNNPDHGFLIAGNPNYFAEALDARDKKLEDVCIDVALCLWASWQHECIIEDVYVQDVVARVMQEDMFNASAGLRTYSDKTDAILFNNGYHRGPNTYWPFVSALVAIGMKTFGHDIEAKKVLKAMLNGVSMFDSPIELFVQNPDGQYQIWHNPENEQMSAKEQAWTAAAVCYAAKELGIS